jgi:hypothetical protein
MGPRGFWEVKGGFTHAMPFPCCSPALPLKATAVSRQGRGRGTVWEWNGMCELASAVQRRHVGDLPEFGTVGEWQGSGSGRGRAWERHGNRMVCVNRPYGFQIP